MYKILIVDDDPNILQMLEHIMADEGYKVLTARSGLDALRIAQDEKPDLCILDIGMPHMDGVMLCRTLRTLRDLDEVPILFLTANNTPYTVADALEAGGDDYIRKPFSVRELTARIRAHLRRSKQESALPTLQIMTRTYQVFVNQREIPLTHIEFELLNFLAKSPSAWFTTQELLEKVWDYPNGVGDAALVRNHVRNIRRKVEDNPEKPVIIQSRPGRGYAIRANVQVS
jgi:DNA-binding response OmpR family regulator